MMCQVLEMPVSSCLREGGRDEGNPAAVLCGWSVRNVSWEQDRVGLALLQVLLQWDSVSSLFWCFSKVPPVWSRPVNITEGVEWDTGCGSLHVLVPTGHNGSLRGKKAKKLTTNPRNCQPVFLSPQQWVGDPAWCHHTDARCFCHFRTQKHLFWLRTTLLLQIPLSSPLHWILQVLFVLSTESFLLGLLKWQCQIDESWFDIMVGNNGFVLQISSFYELKNVLAVQVSGGL